MTDLYTHAPDVAANPPVQKHVACPDPDGGHQMAYWEWGQAACPHVVVCVHGLSRQGRDFDVLARALLARSGGTVRVVCPDVVGRGQSDWLKNPALYQVPTYAADMLALLAQLQATSLDWVGTSMGGLIGMGVAAYLGANAGPSGLPVVRRLVLNDVGPALQWEALQRIGQYIGKVGEFDSVQQAADAMWAISKGFGPHSAAQWLEMSSHMVKPLAGKPGKYCLHYDPALGEPFKSMTQEAAAQGEALLWQAYDSIRAQTLLTRGANSDLLSVATAQAMTQRGPQARLVEFAGVGHAPTLVADDQLDVVCGFLLGA